MTLRGRAELHRWPWITDDDWQILKLMPTAMAYEYQRELLREHRSNMRFYSHNMLVTDLVARWNYARGDHDYEEDSIVAYRQAGPTRASRRRA